MEGFKLVWFGEKSEWFGNYGFMEIYLVKYGRVLLIIGICELEGFCNFEDRGLGYYEGCWFLVVLSIF
jgi:hypothetical protein